MLGMCDCPRNHENIRRHHRHPLPERGWIQFLALMMLNDKPMHGYQLKNEMERQGYVREGRFKTGSLYTILNRMEEHGDLSSTQEQSEEGRTRRVYSVTDDGRLRLKAGLEYMLRRKRLLDKLEEYYKTRFQDGDA